MFAYLGLGGTMINPMEWDIFDLKIRIDFARCEWAYFPLNDIHDFFSRVVACVFPYLRDSDYKQI